MFMMEHNQEHLCSPRDQYVVVIYMINYITSGGGLGEGLGGDGGFLYFGIPVIHRHTRLNLLYAFDSYSIMIIVMSILLST